MEGARGPLML
jgi:hypothetical protein